MLPSFVKLARTIRAYGPSIEATIEWRLTNARDFQDPEAFITMVVLDRNELGPDLAWATTS